MLLEGKRQEYRRIRMTKGVGGVTHILLERLSVGRILGRGSESPILCLWKDKYNHPVRGRGLKGIVKQRARYFWILHYCRNIINS